MAEIRGGKEDMRRKIKDDTSDLELCLFFFFFGEGWGLINCVLDMFSLS